MSSTGNFEHLPLANGDVAPIRIRVDGRAKRISIKVERIGGLVTLTAPTRAALPEARRFLSTRTLWIAEKRAKIEPFTPFADGAAVPVLGRERLIRHAPRAIDPVVLSPDSLTVGGAASALPGVVRAFFKTEAKRRLTTATSAHAARIDADIMGLTVRDTKTRWGSCAATGRLSFSWRLVMAPEHVLDYVAAHEVAHLRHMHHGPEFWALVARLDPAWEKAEAWLKRSGPTLRRYG